jgi:hypothetical protein
MQEMGNPRTFAFYMIIVVVLMSILIMTLVTIYKPYVGYEGVTNSTSLFGTQYQLSFDSVPTIINGIATSTSIIIGFTGAIIGIFYQIFKDNLEMRNILLTSAFLESIPLTLLFIVYDILIMGYVDSALRLALIAFAYALLTFAIVMLGSFYRLAKKRKISEPQSTNENKNQEARQKEEIQNPDSNDGTKTVNITINM